MTDAIPSPILLAILVPLVGWAALELRGMRNKLIQMETWMLSHDVRDDERFETIAERLNRQEGRIESLIDHRRPR